MIRLVIEFRRTRRVGSALATLFLLINLTGFATAGDDVPSQTGSSQARSGLTVGTEVAGSGVKLLTASVQVERNEVGSQSAPSDATQSQPGQREPKDLKDLVETGTAFLAMKEYDKALAAFNEAIGLDPNYAPAFAGRAQTWARKHYRDRELADLGTAIRLDPNNAAYRVARGDSWSAQGQHKFAMADYDEALRMEPNDPAKWVSRGNEWRKHLKLDEAIGDYTQAIQLNRRYAAAYVARGQTWKQRHVFDRAIAEFSELVQVDPDNSEGHRALARILATCTVENVRDGQRAVAFATRACELTRWQDPDCLDTLAAAYAEAGNFESAVNLQIQAIRLVRQNVPSLLLKAQNDGVRRSVGFEDRLAFYKSRKPTRE